MNSKNKKVIFNLEGSKSDLKILEKVLKKGDLKDIAGHKILDIHLD